MQNQKQKLSRGVGPSSLSPLSLSLIFIHMSTENDAIQVFKYQIGLYQHNTSKSEQSRVKTESQPHPFLLAPTTTTSLSLHSQNPIQQLHEKNPFVFGLKVLHHSGRHVHLDTPGASYVWPGTPR